MSLRARGKALVALVVGVLILSGCPNPRSASRDGTSRDGQSFPGGSTSNGGQDSSGAGTATGNGADGASTSPSSGGASSQQGADGGSNHAGGNPRAGASTPGTAGGRSGSGRGDLAGSQPASAASTSSPPVIDRGAAINKARSALARADSGRDPNSTYRDLVEAWKAVSQFSDADEECAALASELQARLEILGQRLTSPQVDDEKPLIAH